MSTFNQAVREYLSFFIETVQNDIVQLIGIAKQGEKDYKDGLAKGLYDRSKLLTTLNPETTVFYTFGSQPSRCTIPLAMTCISSMETLGSLLDSTGYKRNFQNSIQCFFNYASVSITNDELDLLRAIYRNGMMHGFFPKGQKTGITYDSSLNSKLELFYKDGDYVILNVNRLCEITLDVFSKVFTDDTIHVIIDANLTTFIFNNDTETQVLINRVKTNL